MKSVNQQPLISVIVPVYKVEQYLDRCVKSIVNQTYKNLEIILIDDGSPDNSPAICDEWAKKDDRIKVIHKENGGVSRARNLGMELAKGEYISFIDSDDWVHPDFLISLYSAAIENNVKIAACKLNFTHEYKCSFFEIDNENSVKLYSTEDALRTCTSQVGFNSGPCNKLYHKDMLQGEGFVVDKRREDEYFTYKILAKEDQLAFVDLGLYYYYQNESSFMHSFSEQHLDAFDAFLEQLVFYKDRFPKLYIESKLNYSIYCINSYIEIDKLPKKQKKVCRKRIKQYRCQVKYTLKEFMTYSAKHKLYVILSKYFIGITSKLLSFTRNR